MKKILYILLILFVGAGCSDRWDDYYGKTNDERGAGAKQTILDVLKSKADEHKKLISLLEETGLDKQLGSDRVLTLWLPKDGNIDDEVMNLSLIGKKRFILNHINSLALYKTKLWSKNELRTLAGKYVRLSRRNGMSINDIKISKFDIACSNGVIHEIDGVLTPTKNVMEVLLEAGADYSLYRDSILAYNDTIFRRDLSFPIGVNEVGQTIYDSVFKVENTLLRNVDFADEKKQSTLFIPSNKVIEDVFKDMENYYDELGLKLEKKDSLSIYKFIFESSFIAHTLKKINGKKIISGKGRELRLDKQIISTNYEECSNGVVYQFEKLYIPKDMFIKKVDFNTTLLFELPEEEWPNYYQLSNGGKLNNREGHNGETSEDNIFSDRNGLNRKFLSVKADKGEWVDLALLQKDITAKVQRVKLFPGKYKLSGWGYGWRAANVKMYLNNTPILWHKNKSDIIPMGNNGEFEYSKIRLISDTLTVIPTKGHDIIRLEAVGEGSKKDIIRVKQLLFEPVGDNY